MHRLSLVTWMISIAATMPLAAPAQETSLRAWPEYQVIMWQGSSAAKQPDKFPLYYQRLQEIGVSAGMVYGDGDLKPLLAAQFPYYVENMVNRGLCLKFSSKVTDWNSPDYKLTQRARDLTPVFREMRSPLAALFMQARRDRDPVAIHYSQPSIQAAWLLESTVDGSTWLRRFSSFEAAHNRHARVRHGWLKMLEDAGYDPVYVSTQQIEAGELSKFKALLLPQSWAMSDAEATRITEFLHSTDGPRTILADGQIGLFDEHGRLRPTGALDPMIAPGSAASAIVRRLDKPVPRDHVSFEASPAAYANAEAGGGREQTSGWVDKIRDEWLNHVPPTVVVPADARVKVWKYTLPPAKSLPTGTLPIRLLAFERNITYRMGEDLQQSADNSAMTGDISITAQLPAPKHAYDLRSGKYLGHSAELTLNVSSDMPTLIAVSEFILPEENLVEHLLRRLGKGVRNQ